MDVYRLAHEYQIPPAIKGAKSIILKHTSSIALKGHYKSLHSGYPRSTEDDIAEFLKQLFEVLKFGETYEDRLISLGAAERLSTLPMKIVTTNTSYKDITEISKRRIMQYRLERIDRDTDVRDKLGLDLVD